MIPKNNNSNRLEKKFSTLNNLIQSCHGRESHFSEAIYKSIKKYLCNGHLKDTSIASYIGFLEVFLKWCSSNNSDIFCVNNAELISKYRVYIYSRHTRVDFKVNIITGIVTAAIPEIARRVAVDEAEKEFEDFRKSEAANGLAALHQKI